MVSKVSVAENIEWLEVRGDENFDQDRTDYRNGYRERSLSTTMGTVDLRVPRARKALSFSAFEAYNRRWGELDALLLEPAARPPVSARASSGSCADASNRSAPLRRLKL